MTREERRILGPLIPSLRIADPNGWWSLKYQTQFGPEFGDFPYYPAALEFERPAQQAIGALDAKEKTALVKSWQSRPRLLHPESDDAILQQYAVILLDALVQTARRAGARTTEW